MCCCNFCLPRSEYSFKLCCYYLLLLLFVGVHIFYRAEFWKKMQVDIRLSPIDTYSLFLRINCLVIKSSWLINIFIFSQPSNKHQQTSNLASSIAQRPYSRQRETRPGVSESKFIFGSISRVGDKQRDSNVTAGREPGEGVWGRRSKRQLPLFPCLYIDLPSSKQCHLSVSLPLHTHTHHNSGT